MTIAVASGPAGFTAGSTLTATPVNGVATFSNLILNTSGTYTFRATDGSLTSATTVNIAINVAAASKVAFTSVPTSGTAGSALTAIKATVQDAFGNTVTSNTSIVTIAVISGPAGFTAGSTLTATAVNGVATFSNLILNTSGTYTFTATDGSLTSATTGSIAINAAAASKVVFTSVPASGTAGSALTAIQVTVQDANGNTVTSNTSTVTIALSAGSFANGSTSVNVAAVNGVATFNNLILDRSGTYTFTATDGSLTSATSGSIVINAGAASQLWLYAPSSSGKAGTALTAITVIVMDKYTNYVTSDTSTVTIAVASGPAGFTAGSTLTATAVNGVATFSNLILNTSGTYTLKATDGSLTSATSVSIAINAAAASKLAFTQVPSTGTAGSVLSALTVAIEDSYGNIVNTNNSAPTIALNSFPAGGSFTSSSTLTVAAVNGVATFSNLILNTAGTYTFYSFDGSLTAALSGSIVISAASATSVVLAPPPVHATSSAEVVTPTTQTGTAGSQLASFTGTAASPLEFTGTAGSRLASFTATIIDAYGNTVTSDTSTVTIALHSGPSSGFASGSTLTAKAVKGVATFDNLTLHTAGTHTFRATAGSLTSATTGSIVISAAAASKLAFTQVPTTGMAGTPLTALQVAILDIHGNVDTSNTSKVRIAVKSGPGGFTSDSTLTAKAVGGVATFSNLTLNTAGTYTFRVRAGTLTSATAGNIVISAAAASNLVFTMTTSTGSVNKRLGTMTVSIVDAYGNITPTEKMVKLSISSGPSGGNFHPRSILNVKAVNGVAKFSNIKLAKAGTYTLNAFAKSLGSAISGDIDVIDPVSN